MKKNTFIKQNIFSFPYYIKKLCSSRTHKNSVKMAFKTTFPPLAPSPLSLVTDNNFALERERAFTFRLTILGVIGSTTFSPSTIPLVLFPCYFFVFISLICLYDIWIDYIIVSIVVFVIA